MSMKTPIERLSMKIITFEVVDSTRGQREKLKEYISDTDNGGGYEKLDDRTWNFDCAMSDVDGLTDLLDEMNVEYRML